MGMRAAFTIVGIMLILVVVLFLNTFHDAGEFKSVVSRCGCVWVEYKGLPGTEDITIDPDTGLAYISVDDRRAAGKGRPVQGSIYGFDTRAGASVPYRLSGDLPFDFHPHGIGLFRRGEKRLFVINHRTDGHFVEIFRVHRDRLVHLESVSGPLMHSPNDVAPVGPRAFYVTNDHGNATPAGRKVEEYLQLKRSYVLYYDGADFRKVAGGLGYANGVAVSGDGGEVYVASSVGRSLRVYRRNVRNGALSTRLTIDTGFGSDNIEVDADGSLWVAGHPKMLTFLRHAADEAVPSPSKAVRVELKTGGKYAVHEVFQDDGLKLSAASVAAPFPGGFLVGAVFDVRFLACRTNAR
jgi:arylesterase/paraoxonase